MEKRKISENVIRRLPKYYRFLSELSEKKIDRISSVEISEALRLTASQVRQDLFNFGCFGQRGCGYDVEFLKKAIAEILGLNIPHSVIIVGAGRIGQALADYGGFLKEGYTVKAVFDIETEHIKNIKAQIYNVAELENYLAANNTDIAVIATQKDAAEEVAKRLVEAGIKSIWNFAPIDLYFGEDVAVENINMSESLFSLTYKSKKVNAF